MARFRLLVPLAAVVVSLSACQDLRSLGVRNECAAPIDVSMLTGAPPEELEWITVTPHEIRNVGDEDSYKESTTLWLRAGDGAEVTQVGVPLEKTPKGHLVEREAVIAGGACPA